MEHNLPTLADILRQKHRHPERKFGIGRWLREEVFFTHDFPEYQLFPSVDFEEVLKNSESEFAEFKPEEIHILVGIDMETDQIRYQFFVHGLAEITLSPRFVKGLVRARTAS